MPFRPQVFRGNVTRLWQGPLPEVLTEGCEAFCRGDNAAAEGPVHQAPYGRHGEWRARGYAPVHHGGVRTPMHLGRTVTVELLGSIIQGHEQCAFQIHL